MNSNIKINNQVQASFKFIVSKENGDLVKETNWFNNIVLDQGLERMGTGGVCSHCRVGTGSSTPDKTQTELDAQVASTSNITENTTGVNTSQAYGWRRLKYRFGVGVAAGNLTEVGVGWGESGSGNLFNRAKIRDTGGQVSTVTVLDDEVLDVLVELRSYVNVATTTSSGEISSVGYTVTVKPLLTTIGAGFTDAYTCNWAGGYSGEITSLNTSPTGSLGDFGITNQNYVPASLKKGFDVYWGLNQGNAAPLKTVVLRTNYCTYQAQFEPTIPKTAEKVLRLSFDMSWTRYE